MKVYAPIVYAVTVVNSGKVLSLWWQEEGAKEEAEKVIAELQEQIEKSQGINAKSADGFTSQEFSRLFIQVMKWQVQD